MRMNAISYAITGSFAAIALHAQPSAPSARQLADIARQVYKKMNDRYRFGIISPDAVHLWSERVREMDQIDEPLGRSAAENHRVRMRAFRAEEERRVVVGLEYSATPATFYALEADRLVWGSFKREQGTQDVDSLRMFATRLRDESFSRLRFFPDAEAMERAYTASIAVVRFAADSAREAALSDAIALNEQVKASYARWIGTEPKAIPWDFADPQGEIAFYRFDLELMLARLRSARKPTLDSLAAARGAAAQRAFERGHPGVWGPYGIEVRYRWSRRWLDAALMAGVPPLDAARAHAERMRATHREASVYFDIGCVTIADVRSAEYYDAEADWLLLRAESGKLGQEPGSTARGAP